MAPSCGGIRGLVSWILAMTKRKHTPKISEYGPDKAYIRVRLSGKLIALGKADDEEAWDKGYRLIERWKRGGRKWPIPAETRRERAASEPRPKIARIAYDFEQWAESYYTGGHVASYKTAMLHLEPWYDLRADEFGAPELAAYRDRLKTVKNGHGQQFAVSTANKLISRVKQMAAWAEERGYTVPRAWRSQLEPVRMIRPLEPGVKRPDKVSVVPDEIFWKTVDAVKRPVLRDMMLVHWYTGMRVQNLVGLTASELDMSREVWFYTPRHHKNTHRGHKLLIVIGPQAMQIINRHIGTNISEPVFISRRSGKAYTTSGYRVAIRRVCERIGIEPWHPHQVRHSFATRIRKIGGIEMAKIALGHYVGAGVTEIYAEASREKLWAILMKIG
jgi:integrase